MAKHSTLDPRLEKLKAHTKPATKTTPKKKAIVKKEKVVVEKDAIAYVIKDKTFGEFPVLASANAWWMDPTKLELLINAYKYRASNLQASIAVGISERQVEYFIERHPDFCGIIARCKQVSSLKAKQTMVQALDKDLTTVRWFLETVEPAEYGKKPPLVAVQVNMHDRVADRRNEYSQ